ncbi:MAG: hypothetical protein IMZ66_11390, partial [Planctomycetes bacterium]|nr:hypothetical protein [Planctomycetota bacterium]
MSDQQLTRLLLAGVAIGVLAAAAPASIITAGDVTSSYSGPGPWTISGEYNVGNTGVGSVTVNGNSVVTSDGPLQLGKNASGNGTITLNDGDWTANHATCVGLHGTGKIEVLPSSRLRTNQIAYVGMTGGAVGMVDLNGGRWD